MRGDKMRLWLQLRSQQAQERLRRPQAVPRSPHALIMLAFLLLAQLPVLISANTDRYTFDKQDSKHVGYWVDEKASRVTKLTLYLDHIWVTSSTFQAACSLGQYFGNNCPIPTKCIQESISTSSQDPRYKGYREVVEYDDGSRETCLDDENPPNHFPTTAFTPFSCITMTITLAPYYTPTAPPPPEDTRPTKYANIGCRPLLDDSGIGWNPQDVIYAAMGTAPGVDFVPTSTADAGAGVGGGNLKLVETRTLINVDRRWATPRPEDGSSNGSNSNNSRGNNDDNVPLLGGISIFTDENGSLQVTEGSTRTSSSNHNEYTGPLVTTSAVAGAVSTTTLRTVTYPPGHSPGPVTATIVQPSVIQVVTYTLTTKRTPVQGSMPGEGGGGDQEGDKNSMTTTIATILTNSSDHPNSVGNGNNSFINPTGTGTTSTGIVPTNTGKEGVEGGVDRTTKYENNHKWVTVAVIMGAITGAIFTCLAGWCVFSRWYIRRVLRVEWRRSPSPCAPPLSGESSDSEASGTGVDSASGARGAGDGVFFGGGARDADSGDGSPTDHKPPSSIPKPTKSLLGFLACMAKYCPNNLVWLFNLFMVQTGRRYRADSRFKGQDEEQGHTSQDPFRDPPFKHSDGTRGGGVGVFRVGGCNTKNCRDCQNFKKKESRKTMATQLSVIDEVTEPGSKRGSKREMTPSLSVDEESESDVDGEEYEDGKREIEMEGKGEMEEEVYGEIYGELKVGGRDIWPASPRSPDRLLLPLEQGDCGSGCKSGEVVDMYMKRGSSASSSEFPSLRNAEEKEEEKEVLERGVDEKAEEGGVRNVRGEVEGEAEDEAINSWPTSPRKQAINMGMRLSIIDEVTEPGSKRGSGVYSKAEKAEEGTQEEGEEEVEMEKEQQVQDDVGGEVKVELEHELELELEEEVRNEVRYSWPASPHRSLRSVDTRSAGSRESSEMVHVYLG